MNKEIITSDYYSSDSGEQNVRSSAAKQERKGGGKGEEDTPVDTPRGEGEWNGQDETSRAVEEVSTAVSEVRKEGRRKCFVLLWKECVCVVVVACWRHLIGARYCGVLHHAESLLCVHVCMCVTVDMLQSGFSA